MNLKELSYPDCDKGECTAHASQVFESAETFNFLVFCQHHGKEFSASGKSRSFFLIEDNPRNLVNA